MKTAASGTCLFLVAAAAALLAGCDGARGRPGAGSIATARFTDSGIAPAIPTPPAKRRAAFRKSRSIAILSRAPDL